MSSYLRMIFNSTEVEAINKEGVIDGLIKDLQTRCQDEIEYFDCMGWYDGLMNLASENFYKWLVNEWSIVIGWTEYGEFKLNFVGDVYNSQFIKILLETIASVLSDGIIVIVNVDYDIVHVYKVVEHKLIEE